MLPISSRARVATPLETALFTATSAACVTGLIIQDTAQYWSAFGQTVIICLIQIGGMGVVTMAVVLMMFSGRKIGIKQRWIMQESISAPQVGGIVRMAGMILKTTLLVEGLGALLLALRAVAVQLTPGPGWNLFCGFCLALSVIVPGMSFSTLLMPLGLYAPFLEGIGRFDPGVIFPGGLGAAATLILLSRAAARLMQRRYGVMFHAIIGVIAAATIVIIPGFAGVRSALVNAACAAAGAVCALALARLNAAVEGA